MKVTTLIPISLNDGTPVSEEQIKGYLTRFWAVFGGLTVEGKVDGHWVNDSGVHFMDTCIKIFCIIEDGQLDSFEAIVMQIGKELKQEAMYLEIDPKVKIKIIDTK